MAWELSTRALSSLALLAVVSVLGGWGLNLLVQSHLQQVEHAADRIASLVEEVRTAPGDATLEIDLQTLEARGIPLTIEGERLQLTMTPTTVTVLNRGSSATASWYGEVRLGEPQAEYQPTSLTFDLTHPWIIQRIGPPEGEPGAEAVTYVYLLP